MEGFGIGRFECFMIQLSASQDFGLKPLIYGTDTTPDNSVMGANHDFSAFKPVSSVISGIHRRS